MRQLILVILAVIAMLAPVPVSAQFFGGGGSGKLPSGPPTQYVNPATGNDNNSGTSPSAPLQTVAKALSRIPPVLDRAYTINLADGTYPECINVTSIASAGWGFTDTLTLNIVGNSAAPGNVVFTGQCAYQAESIGVNESAGARLATNANVVITGVQFAPSSASTYALIADGARRVVLNNVNTAGNVTNGIGVFWSAVTIKGTINVANFTQWGMWAAFGRSTVVGQNPTLIVTPKSGTTASGCFHAELNAVMDIEGASGSITCNGQVTTMWDVDTVASVFTNLPLTVNNSGGTPANSQIWFVHHGATSFHTGTISATNFTHTCSVLEPASANQGPGGRTFTNVGAANLNLGGQCILF